MAKVVMAGVWCAYEGSSNNLQIFNACDRGIGVSEV
jgi:hypothetical protein